MNSVLGADAATHHVGVMALHGADPLRQAAAAGLPSLRPPSQHTHHMQHPHAQQQDAMSLPAAAAAAARGSSESSVLPFAAGADAADEDIGGGGGRVRRRSTTAYKISLTVESEVGMEEAIALWGGVQMIRKFVAGAASMDNQAQP